MLVKQEKKSRYSQNIPASTGFPPLSSSGLTSFQKTRRIWLSLAVRVTRTSPSFSSSSIACGASFHDSLRLRTDNPPPCRVCLCISVSNAAFVLKV